MLAWSGKFQLEIISTKIDLNFRINFSISDNCVYHAGIFGLWLIAYLCKAFWIFVCFNLLFLVFRFVFRFQPNEWQPKWKEYTECLFFVRWKKKFTLHIHIISQSTQTIGYKIDLDFRNKFSISDICVLSCRNSTHTHTCSSF